MLIILLAGILGICAAIGFDVYVPGYLSSYIAIVIISAVDSALCALKSMFEDKINVYNLATDFFVNTALALIMVFLGKKIELDLNYAVLVVFTLRIFKNVSVIKSALIKKMQKN